MSENNTFTMEELTGMIDKAVAARLPEPTANLEKGMDWLDKEIMGVPVVPALVGGTIAEVVAAFVAKSKTLAGQNKMIVDLAAAAALGYVAKRKNMEWAKYGAMFLVFSAFQTQIQALVAKIPGLSATTTEWAQDSDTGNGAGMGMAQGNDQTPAEVEQWLRSGSR